MIKIQAILNFIHVLMNPKDINNLNQKEIKELAENLNYKFIKKLEGDNYRDLLDSSDDLFKRLFDNIDNKKDVIECIKFDLLKFTEIVSILKLSSNYDLSKEEKIKLIMSLLSKVGSSNLLKKIHKEGLFKDLISDGVIDHIQNLKEITGYSNKFLENLNTIIDLVNGKEGL